MNWRSTKERKRRLRKLFKDTCECSLGGGASYDKEKDCYFRCYGTTGRPYSRRKYYKKYSNKVVRQNFKKLEEPIREKGYYRNGAFVNSWIVEDW